MSNSTTPRQSKNGMVSYGQEVITPVGALIMAVLAEPVESFNKVSYRAGLAWKGDSHREDKNAPLWDKLMQAAVDVAVVQFKLTPEQARADLESGKIRPPIYIGKEGDPVLFCDGKKVDPKDAGTLKAPLVYERDDEGRMVAVDKANIDDRFSLGTKVTLKVEVYATGMQGNKVNCRLIAAIRVADGEPLEAKEDSVSDDDLAQVPDFGSDQGGF